MILPPPRINLSEVTPSVARAAGRRAHARGLDLDQNPYSATSTQGKAWKDGFLDAWADAFCKKESL